MTATSGAVTSVLGIAIPSRAPLFLGVVAVHVTVALACIVAGAATMLSEKGTTRHRAFGSVYYWCLTAVFVSASALAIMRWSEDYRLFVLGALSFAAATVGRTAALGRRLRLHIAGMGSSYILLLTAFYVDNGRQLPLWRELPPIAYWTLPAAAGFPIMLWALLRHPVIRKYRAGSPG